MKDFFKRPPFYSSNRIFGFVVLHKLLFRGRNIIGNGKILLYKKATQWAMVFVSRLQPTGPTENDRKHIKSMISETNASSSVSLFLN